MAGKTSNGSGRRNLPEPLSGIETKNIVPLRPIAAKPRSSQHRERMAVSPSGVAATVSRIDKKAHIWSKPWWLRSLTRVSTISSVTTILLGAAALTMYASTVYHQQQWSKEYGRLEHLRREERQLSATNEVLKNSIAETAEQPGVGLVPPEAAPTILLEAAPPSPPAAPKPTPTRMAPLVTEPLGY